jgi:hypothetical protein
VNISSLQHDQPRPPVYEIRIKGHLGRQWTDWLGGLAITWEEAGTSLLTGAVADQAALHGLLRKLRDLGVPLISINSKEKEMISSSTGGIGMSHGGEGGGTAWVKDRRVVLASVWIFALINYIYADIFTSFFDPAAHSGTPGITMGSIMVFAALMETAIVMVLLARILKQRPNRLLNIIVGAVQAAFVTWSLIGKPPTPFYVFFVTIEIASLLFIIGYAWTWKKEKEARA